MSFIDDAMQAAKDTAQKAADAAKNFAGGVAGEVFSDAKKAVSDVVADPSRAKEIAQNFVEETKQTITQGTSPSPEASAPADGITLRVKDSSGATIYEGSMGDTQNILDECGEKGVDLPFSCHAGACMSCAAQVTCGRDLIDHQRFGSQYIETDDDTILTCIAGPKEGAKGTIEMQMLM